MKTGILFLGVMMAAQSVTGECFPPQVGLETVRAHIDSAPAEHPRLLADAAELRSLRGVHLADGLRGQLAQAIIAQAESYLEAAPVTRTLEGRRLLGESRRCVKRVLYLAMAYHLTADKGFATRCEQEMLAAARFDDWNPSHFLDVGEMAFALAIGYDWLHDVLPPDSRGKIRKALVEKAIVLPFTTPHRRWVDAENNWGQVCHGGLTAGALAVLEDEPELAARTVHQAVHHVPRSMAALAPKGSYPEGPGYWAYGTTYNVLLIAVLESALGTDYGLSHAPGFDRTGQYLSLVTGPSGRTFNYADGGAGRAPQPAVHWFAGRFRRPDWSLGETPLLKSEIPRLLGRNPRDSRSRFLPMTLLWMSPNEFAGKNVMPLHWSGEGEVPITVHRGSWTDPDATFIGLKGGSPSANHGQMDTGSFVLDAMGRSWALDLGAEGYHAIESRGMSLWNRNQDSDRWKIFRQSNLGHNTLAIDGKPQWVKGAGRFVQFSDDPVRPFSVLDMSGVYEGQAESVQRGVAMRSSGEVLIQDELGGLRPGSRVRWGMITPAKLGDPGSDAIVLSQGDARMTLRLLSPTAANWRIVDTTTPPQDWDSPNPGTQMVAFEAVAPADGALTLGVLATPSRGAQPPRNQVELRPLASWETQGDSSRSLRR